MVQGTVRSYVLAFLLGSLLLTSCASSPSISSNSTPTPATESISIGQYAGSYAAPVLGLVVDTSLRVLFVEAGSGAERSHIQRDDVITAVDGVQVGSPSAIKQLLEQRNRTAVVQITVSRNGQPTSVSVHPTAPAPRQTTPTPVPTDEYYL